MKQHIEVILAGCAIIVCGILIAAGVNRAAEAYSMSLAARCDAQILAASLVELHGIHCPGAADFGHSEATIALCGMARGRTPEQVARLPQCLDAAPVRLLEGVR